jgi:hypothetical protein
MIIDTDLWSGFDFRSQYVARGASEGAGASLEMYGDIMMTHEGSFFLGAILAPVLVPAVAIAGASLARSEQEVDAALAAFKSVGRDEALFRSLDERVLARTLAAGDLRYLCLTSTPPSSDLSCAWKETSPRLRLRPEFTVIGRGDFEPEILLLARVTGSFSGSMIAPGDVRWSYRKNLGDFFELARNDGELLRQEIEVALNLFASKISDDVFLNPSAQSVVLRKEKPYLSSSALVPEGVVLRVEQASVLASSLTHATLYPISDLEQSCSIVSVDGAGSFPTSSFNYGPPWQIAAGERLVKLSCLQHPFFGTHSYETRELSLVVEAGKSYATDGTTYTSMPAPR